MPDGYDPNGELGPFFDTAGLCRRLGVTRQALNGRVHRNTLLGVKADDGSILYPTWQFTPDMAVLGGLPELLRVLDAVAPDGFSKAVWLCAPQARLGGRSAAELLAAGADLEPLLQAAQADVDRLSH